LKIFIDTSSLCKRYLEEEGSSRIEKLFGEITEVLVSPVTWIEFNSAVSKRLRNHSLTLQTVSWTLSEAKKDFEFFYRVAWNVELEAKAAKLGAEHPLSTLDAIQLASGILSKADIFVTSDQRLAREARKLIRKVEYI